MKETLGLVLYDTAHYPAAGAAAVSWFSVPLGGTAVLIRDQGANTVQKTEADTNYRDPFHPFAAYEIRAISLLPMTLVSLGSDVVRPVDHFDAIIRLIQCGSFELSLVDPLSPAVPPPARYVSVDLARLMPDWWNAEAVARLRPGWLEAEDHTWGAYRLLLEAPVLIPANMRLSATACFAGSPALPFAVDLRLRLHGLQTRPRL